MGRAAGTLGLHGAQRARSRYPARPGRRPAAAHPPGQRDSVRARSAPREHALGTAAAAARVATVSDRHRRAADGSNGGRDACTRQQSGASTSNGPPARRCRSCAGLIGRTWAATGPPATLQTNIIPTHTPAHPPPRCRSWAGLIGRTWAATGLPAGLQARVIAVHTVGHRHLDVVVVERHAAILHLPLILPTQIPHPNPKNLVI